MQPQSTRHELRKTARTLAVGVVCGFLLGAFFVAAIVWRYDSVIGSRAASLDHPADTPSAMDRWTGGIDDAGDGVLRAGEPAGAAAAAGMPPDVMPPPAPELVIGAPPADELAGRDLIVPVEGITRDQLTRSFSDSRGSRQHEAIDILAPRNTPVLAVEGGTIARLFHSRAGGITIYQFDPTGRFCYYYAHLERYADGLVEGQPVRQGEIIGYVGATGNAPRDTPHLHFAIFRLTSAKRWWEGTPLDPFEVLR